MIAMPSSQRYPWNIHLINSVEDIFVLLTRQVLIVIISFFQQNNAEVTFAEKPQMKINSLNER